MGAKKKYIGIVEALNDLTNILQGIGMDLDLNTNFERIESLDNVAESQ